MRELREREGSGERTKREGGSGDRTKRGRE